MGGMDRQADKRSGNEGFTLTRQKKSKTKTDRERQKEITKRLEGARARETGTKTGDKAKRNPAQAALERRTTRRVSSSKATPCGALSKHNINTKGRRSLPVPGPVPFYGVYGPRATSNFALLGLHVLFNWLPLRSDKQKPKSMQTYSACTTSRT